MADWFAENAPAAAPPIPPPVSRPVTPAPPAPAQDWFATNAPKPPEPSPIAKTAAAFWEGIGGQALTDLLGGASRDPKRAQKALDAFKAIVTGIAAEPGRIAGETVNTGASMLKGDLSGTAFHLAGMVPFLGAPAQQVGMDVDRGDPAAAVGHTAALVVPMVAGPLAEATGRAAATTGTVARGATIGAVKAIPAAATAAIERSVYGALGGPEGMIAAAKIAAAKELAQGAITGARGALTERAAAAAARTAAEQAAEQAAREAADAALARQANVTDARDAMVNPPRQLPPGPIITPAPPAESFVQSVPGMYPTGPNPARALPAGPARVIEMPGPEAPPSGIEVTPAMLDAIARAQAGKPYKKLNATDQAAVVEIARRVNTPPETPAPPAAASGDTSFVRAVPAQPAEIIPPTLRTNAPAEAAATALRDEIQPIQTASETAAPKPPNFKERAQDAKATIYAQQFYENGITSADVLHPEGGMTDQQWTELAKNFKHDSPSEVTRAMTLQKLDALWQAEQPGPTTAAQGAAAFQQAKTTGAATIEPNAESTPTPRPVTGEQSRGARPPVYGPREPGAPVARGSATVVKVPGETTTYQGQYAVRELDDIHASHNAHTFQKNPDYYFQNDRDYSNPTNKERVVVNSKADTFDPAYPLADSPDATHGAPVIDSDGNVLGGNNRAMILDRVYKNNPTGAAAYRAELARKAQGFGIDPAQIAGMKRPVLVRELTAGELDAQRAITNLNKTGTAALTAAERATADARTITPAAADYLAKAIDAEGTDATLNDVLSGKNGAAIVNKLVDDGVFTMQEKPNLVDARTGSVTAAGKERVSKMLLGQVFESADQLTRTPPELRAKLERVVSPILQSGQKAGFALLPTLRESIDLLEYARAHGMTNLQDAIAQESMFGNAPQFSSAAVDLAQFLRDSKPNEVSKAFRRYVTNAEPTMFGKSTPAEAFSDAFGGSAPPATLGDMMPKEPPAAATPRKRRSKPTR